MPIRMINRIVDMMVKPALYPPIRAIPLPVTMPWVSSRKISRTIRTIINITPVLIPLVVPKVLLKYSMDSMELITDVEKAAKETKLLINCDGYAGRDTTLSNSPLSELVLRAKLTCSPLSRDCR
jgi:hypothetical protein